MTAASAQAVQMLARRTNTTAPSGGGSEMRATEATSRSRTRGPCWTTNSASAAMAAVVAITPHMVTIVPPAWNTRMEVMDMVAMNRELRMLLQAMTRARRASWARCCNRAYSGVT